MLDCLCAGDFSLISSCVVVSRAFRLRLFSKVHHNKSQGGRLPEQVTLWPLLRPMRVPLPFRCHECPQSQVPFLLPRRIVSPSSCSCQTYSKNVRILVNHFVKTAAQWRQNHVTQTWTDQYVKCSVPSKSSMSKKYCSISDHRGTHR